MKAYQADYSNHYNNFLGENQKNFRTYCLSKEDCKESYLEKQYLNDACDRIIQLRRKTVADRTFVDNFKEKLKDDFEIARLSWYKQDSYVDSFIRRDLENLRKKHISKYNDANDDYRCNNYCYYDFMLKSSRNDVLIYLAEYNVLRDILDNPKLLNQKNLSGIKEGPNNNKDEEAQSSILNYSVSDIVDSLKQYIEDDEILKLIELLNNGKIEGTITVTIAHKMYFIRFFGRLYNMGFFKKWNKCEVADWLVKYFRIKNKKSQFVQTLKKDTEYKTLTNRVVDKSDFDIKIKGIED